MGTVTIPDNTLARLKAAAEARHVSLEAYLDELSANGAESKSSGPARNDRAEGRAAAADSIRQLATEVKGKATLKELIADKHAGHKH